MWTINISWIEPNGKLGRLLKGRKPKEEAMSDYLTKVKQLLEAAATAAYATLSHLALCSTI
ncbi:unnamed protein product [Musa acuminata subsp. malaccensis]|uniref:(wild Malaysian banana) hypothetical protein n=1 Tax=Musa acuminata subsp. malaccensis TaxID=214687 RepID=A0A804HWB5_MUSAM|nr:unnamed protein product [Musa acuminata subsp. malaccensis]